MKGPDRAPSLFRPPAARGLVLLRHSGLELVRPLQAAFVERQIAAALYPIDRQIGEQIRKPIEDQVARELYSMDSNDDLRSWSRLHAQENGLHDACSQAERAFLAKECGIERPLWRPYDALCRSTGWWWLFEDVCLLSERPSELRRDSRGRLHAQDGPAIAYPCDWKVFAWHGFVMPDDKTWILDDTRRITVEAIDAEPHPDLRRIMCEVSDFEPLQAVATVIATDLDSNSCARRLMTARLTAHEIRWLEVLDGTPAPDGARTLHKLWVEQGDTPTEAMAAFHGIEPSAYREALRT